MNLHDLCCSAGICCDIYNIEINSIKSDSRRIEKGDFFVCVRGLEKDGHDFVHQAEELGAAAILAEREVETSLPVLYTQNTRRCLPLLYDAWYGHPSKKLKLVAVTGTNGKTSVTYMLKAIFDASMQKCGLIGTVDSFIGEEKIERKSHSELANMTTPDPEELFRQLALMAEGGAEYVFMEASSHALTLDKLYGLNFEAAVFTNLTPEHLDFHRDMEDYFLSKAKLFEASKKKIINTDEPYGKRLFSMHPDACGCSTVRKCCRFYASDVRDMGVDGTEYLLVSNDKRFLVRTPTVGHFNVMNTLEAAACAVELGVSPSAIKCGLASMSGAKGRLEKIKLGTVSDYSVFIDYAHTPDAMKNLLETVCRLRKCSERIVLVFGCGGDRDKSKRKKMGEIAARYADFTVVTSDNSRSEEPRDIIYQIEEGIGDAPHIVIENRREAIEYVIKNALAGDIILLVGKGHEEYEIDKKGKHYFNEKEIVIESANKFI